MISHECDPVVVDQGLLKSLVILVGVNVLMQFVEVPVGLVRDKVEGFHHDVWHVLVKDPGGCQTLNGAPTCRHVDLESQLNPVRHHGAG